MAARHLHLKRGAWLEPSTSAPLAEKRSGIEKSLEDIIDLLEMEPYRKKVVGLLPYGVRKRVELGRALALEPRLLLLDEPMAGMNLRGERGYGPVHHRHPRTQRYPHCFSGT